MNIDFRVIYQSMDCSKLLLEHEKEYYKNNLANVVLQLSNGMDLPDDWSIIIPDDFEKEIIEFQTSKGLRTGFTKNDMGTAFAKVLDYKEDGKLIVVTFINKALIFAIQSDFAIENAGDQKNEFIRWRNIAINIIHHELIHIYDHYMAGDIYDEIEKSNEDGILAKQMRNIALVVWKEYFACRLSALTFDLDLKNEIDSLANEVSSAEEKMKKVIQEYREHGDINIIDKELQGMVTIVLNYSSYLQGHLFVYNDTNKIFEIVQTIQKELSKSFLADIWIDMFYELNEIFDNYLKWDDSAFNKLSKTILKSWNIIGVFPRETENGRIYYSIP